ncbi:hypothetical protein BDZ91DRAFT_735578 [Kalaharituber pfeilii]|nr:hypothetical protein BDZ91DRAFT_735578 [Kalaharituber pfeilii]
MKANFGVFKSVSGFSCFMRPWMSSHEQFVFLMMLVFSLVRTPILHEFLCLLHIFFPRFII